MKIRKNIFVIMLAMLTAMAAGCSLDDGRVQKKPLEYDNETDLTSLDEHVLSDKIKELNCPNDVRENMSVVYTIDTLINENVVGLVRYNKGKYYSVTKVENGGYLFLLYESNGETYYLADGMLVSTLVDTSLSADIEKGMSRDEIIEKDPSAYVGLDCSYHRLNDKSTLVVNYIEEDGSYVVSETGFSSNPASVLHYLTDEDFDEILG
ncbi:MAG: hypothetical protein HFH14_03520 [Lachnospiraceae bacterium]|nr:hypothetical protein [Lachnospiraceae bacterium]